jgi:predicted regulator of Ras-like GTPase activity (Roadblock/LC7/MglB family)
MFEQAIQNVVEGVDGGLAGMLIDFEGIPVASYSKENARFDIEAVGAEASVLVKSIQRATEMLEAGDTREVSIRSERMITLIRVLNDTYILAITLSPDGNLGKARYLLRVVAPKMAAELSV